jgi:hypothetical protein
VPNLKHQCARALEVLQILFVVGVSERTKKEFLLLSENKEAPAVGDAEFGELQIDHPCSRSADRVKHG